MSLINDALKRAKQAQQKGTPSSVSPMRPIETKTIKRDFSWILPVTIILLIIIAVFFIAMATAKHKMKVTIAEISMTTTQPVETTVASGPQTDVIGPAAIDTEAPKPARIQGIAYDPVNPWAIVSGKTVYIGDFVDGMRVMSISRDAITLVGNGQTNKLVVGQQ